MPISIAIAKDLVRALCRHYPVLATSIAYKIREQQTEAIHESTTIKSAGIVRGDYFPRRRFVAIATANIRDENHFTRVVKHEALGHFGINTFTATDKRKLLDAILKTKSAPEFATLWLKVDALYQNTDEDYKAEEIFAFACEEINHKIRANTVLGEQALRECLAGKNGRAMRLQDLINIAEMVAEGLHDETRKQQNFPDNDNALF